MNDDGHQSGTISGSDDLAGAMVSTCANCYRPGSINLRIQTNDANLDVKMQPGTRRLTEIVASKGASILTINITRRLAVQFGNSCSFIRHDWIGITHGQIALTNFPCFFRNRLEVTPCSPLHQLGKYVVFLAPSCLYQPLTTKVPTSSPIEA
jgi:hypothetical protein